MPDRSAARHAREGLSALQISAHNPRGSTPVRAVLAHSGVAAVLALVVLTSQAVAAEIRAVRGRVLVNQGTGFRAVEGSMQLKIGDAAIAAPHSAGSLSYGDGCTIDVTPGQIVWIGPQSACTALGSGASVRDPAPVLQPRVKFDPNWLRDGAALIDPRKPPAGP